MCPQLNQLHGHILQPNDVALVCADEKGVNPCGGDIHDRMTLSLSGGGIGPTRSTTQIAQAQLNGATCCTFHKYSVSIDCTITITVVLYSPLPHVTSQVVFLLQVIA